MAVVMHGTRLSIMDTEYDDDDEDARCEERDPQLLKVITEP